MDVDIDFRTDFVLQDYFPEAVIASRVQDGALKPHPVGAYFQQMPKDRLTGLAAIPYEQAEDLGYFKIDFLHLSLLDVFESKEEIRGLLKREPDWNLLQIPFVVSKLFQIHRHFELISKIKPQNVEELADCIALIRPGKRWLVDKYTTAKNREAVRSVLYQKPDDGRPYYKKPHSVAYALAIVLQLHLIKANAL